MFIGTKFDIGHIRIFGCPVYFHVSKDNPTERKVHLLDIVKILIPLEYIFLAKGRLSLERMCSSMKMLPLGKTEIFFHLL